MAVIQQRVRCGGVQDAQCVNLTSAALQLKRLETFATSPNDNVTTEISKCIDSYRMKSGLTIWYKFLYPVLYHKSSLWISSSLIISSFMHSVQIMSLPSQLIGYVHEQHIC